MIQSQHRTEFVLGLREHAYYAGSDKARSLRVHGKTSTSLAGWGGHRALLPSNFATPRTKRLSPYFIFKLCLNYALLLICASMVWRCWIRRGNVCVIFTVQSRLRTLG